MKILIVCSWALPHVGGVSTYVDQLRKGLEREGHDVDLFSPTPDGQSYYVHNQAFVLEKSKIAPIIAEKANQYFNQHFPGLDSWIKDCEIERYCLEIAAVCWGLNRYDVIHAQDSISAHAMARVKSGKTALITSIHGCLALEWFVNLKDLGIPEQDHASLLWHYCAGREHIGATSGDLTIIPSNWLKSVLMKDFHVPEKHLIIVPYGMDEEPWIHPSTPPVDLNKPQDRKVILCSARFDVVKGHEHFLRALAILAAERSDWVCWLTGNGTLANELKQLTTSLGLQDHVVFLGDRSDVRALLDMADLFVLPSLQDNQPFAVIEAQLAGKPIIVSDAGGITEMVAHQLTGLVFQAANHVELYQHLQYALDHPEFCRRLGYHAQTWANKYWSLSAMTKRNLHVYHQAIQLRYLPQH
ncbi:glycosyltransferase family 4 protein [Paenibacillus sp. UNC451MF]|uniref:glycosyltransferase family 4 protein n=1 Tax=Paenibacillus sp. UNC451MF TaxID=1449063 RepID=UPI0004900B53|nr:glycosyltransferase family 4 protein [Paenibacillus sp. UNC451MF]